MLDADKMTGRGYNMIQFRQLLYRAAALTLSLALALTTAACAKGEAASGADASGGQSGTATGRWVEENVTPKEAVRAFNTSVMEAEDGSLYCYATLEEGGIVKFTSTDGGSTWSSELTGWEEATGGGNIGCINVLPDGTVVFASYSESDSHASQCWIVRPGETPQQVDVSGVGQYITNLALFDTDTLLVTAMEWSEPKAETPAEQIGSDGMVSIMRGAIIDLAAGTVAQTLDNDTLYIMAAANSCPVDTSTGEPRLVYLNFGDSPALMSLDKTGKISTLCSELDTQNPEIGSACDSSGNFYYVDGGICRIGAGGSVQERVVEGASFHLGLTDSYCMDLAVTQEGSFFAVLGMKELYRYTWDETLPAAGGDALSVWSLEENSSVRAAVAAFAAQHPDVNVEYRPVLSDGGTKADAISALNTQLLAGGGPDVLILDGVDYESYAEKGLLADLSGIVDLNSMAQEVVKPFTGDDGTCYVLPARFSIPILCGSAEDLASITDLGSLAQTVLACSPQTVYDPEDDAYYNELSESERYALGFVSLEQFLDFTLQTSSANLVSDGALNEETVRDVLEFINTVGGYYGMGSWEKTEYSNGIMVSDGDSDVVSMGDGGYTHFLMHNARYGWDMMTTPYYLRDVMSAGESAILQPGTDEGAYCPAVLAAVNASSEKQEQAAQLLACLFGEDVQNSDQRDGMPVLQSALDTRIERACADGKADKALMESLLATIKTPVTEPDEEIRASLLTHAQAMLTGSETLDDAVEGVRNDLSLYLAEQQ